MCFGSLHASALVSLLTFEGISMFPTAVAIGEAFKPSKSKTFCPRQDTFKCPDILKVLQLSKAQETRVKTVHSLWDSRC